MKRESKRLDGVADWYSKEQLGIDRRFTSFRFQTLKPLLEGPAVLELGCGDGSMTRLLAALDIDLTVVDGSAELLDNLDIEGVEKRCALFEEFEPDRPFNTVIAEHVLEHVEDPEGVLARVQDWLAPEGRLIVGVPNANSIHRLAAVKMGLLERPTSLGDRDHAVGHRRVFTLELLGEQLERSGFEVVDSFGVFLKPVTAAQIDAHWTPEMVDGFFELGLEYPELAAELTILARRSGDQA